MRETLLSYATYRGLPAIAGIAPLEAAAEPGLSVEACVARLKRIGQRKKVHVMLGIANGTVQARAFRNLLKNDELVNEVIRNASDLRNVIFGG